MWVKRTATELLQEQRRKVRRRLRVATVFGFFVAALTLFFFGWQEAGVRGRIPVPVDEIVWRLPLSLTAGAIVGFLFFKFWGERSTMICPDCETTKYDDGICDCSCGGCFHKTEEMKHVTSHQDSSDKY
jgi:hypothetical protein